MQMNGMNELITVAKYWQRVEDPRLIVLVLNNRDLNQVTWEQRAMAGDPKFEASQNVPDFPYARYAELLGFKGIFVDRPDQLGRGLGRRALPLTGQWCSRRLPIPNVPPLPPHITLKQAKAFATTLIKGDPSEWQVIKETAKELVSDILPSRS